MKRSIQKTVKFIYMITPVILVLTAIVMSGCDISARWDLRRAERALKEADNAHAEQWAEREYRKAQKYLVEAMDLARERKINEARDAALEAKDWAEEATDLAIRRAEEMEKEHDALKSKKF